MRYDDITLRQLIKHICLTYKKIQLSIALRHLHVIYVLHCRIHYLCSYRVSITMIARQPLAEEPNSIGTVEKVAGWPDDETTRKMRGLSRGLNCMSRSVRSLETENV